MVRQASHSCADAEHYTPSYLAEAAQEVLGAIDLDPSSTAKANETICACRYYDAVEDGLAQIWGGRVFVNPPGDKTGKLVKAFWRRANEHALTAGPGSAVLWAGFNVQQLCSLQKVKDLARGVLCPSPLDWPHVVFRDRIKWVRGKIEIQLGFEVLGVDEKVVSKNTNPAHGNYFCLLGGDRNQRIRFERIFSKWGRYTP